MNPRYGFGTINGNVLKGNTEHSCKQEPTLGLRFIVREGKRILQQATQCRVCGKTEWHDVPLVVVEEEQEE